MWLTADVEGLQRGIKRCLNENYVITRNLTLIFSYTNKLTVDNYILLR